MKTKHSFTNADILFSILVNARKAERLLSNLKEEVESLFGEESVLALRLEAIYENLDCSQLLYDLGYHDMNIDQPEHFIDWVTDTTEQGPCEYCAHCIPEPGQNKFTRCALISGHFSNNYTCHQFQEKENP